MASSAALQHQPGADELDIPVNEVPVGVQAKEVARIVLLTRRLGAQRLNLGPFLALYVALLAAIAVQFISGGCALGGALCSVFACRDRCLTWGLHVLPDRLAAMHLLWVGHVGCAADSETHIHTTPPTVLPLSRLHSPAHAATRMC